MLSTLSMVGNEITAVLSMPIEAWKYPSLCAARDTYEKWILVLMGMMGREISYYGPCRQIETLGYEPVVLDECRGSDRYARPHEQFQDSVEKLFRERGLPSYVFTHSLGWHEGSTLLAHTDIEHLFMIAPSHTPNPNLLWAGRKSRLGVPEAIENRAIEEGLERIAVYPEKVTAFYSRSDRVVLHDGTLEALGVETHFVQDLDTEGLSSWRHFAHAGLPSSPVLWKKIREQIISQL